MVASLPADGSSKEPTRSRAWTTGSTPGDTGTATTRMPLIYFKPPVMHGEREPLRVSIVTGRSFQLDFLNVPSTPGIRLQAFIQE